MSVSKIKVYLHEVEFSLRQAKNERKNFKDFMERLGNMLRFSPNLRLDMLISIMLTKRHIRHI